MPAIRAWQTPSHVAQVVDQTLDAHLQKTLLNVVLFSQLSVCCQTPCYRDTHDAVFAFHGATRGGQRILTNVDGFDPNTEVQKYSLEEIEAAMTE